MPTTSPKTHILEQVHQLADEYEQAVQAEKKNGKVEFSKDTNTGEEIFFFKDNSYTRINDLYTKLNEQIDQLSSLYTQVYRDETNPTPFPTQASPAENKAYYDLLITNQGQKYCPWKFDENTENISVYRPDEGKYEPMIIGDVNARCEVWGQMVEEFRVAPLMEKVNKDADIETIRQITGKLDLTLAFQTITSLANAPWQNAALFTDTTGTKYYVDVETVRCWLRLAPNLPSHREIPADKTKSMDELRGTARQFATTNSPRFNKLEVSLSYEENCKSDICFFSWNYRNNDWSGTDWMMMPPFIQVGVLKSGEILKLI